MFGEQDVFLPEGSKHEPGKHNEDKSYKGEPEATAAEKPPLVSIREAVANEQANLEILKQSGTAEQIKLQEKLVDMLQSHETNISKGLGEETNVIKKIQSPTGTAVIDFGRSERPKNAEQLRAEKEALTETLREIEPTAKAALEKLASLTTISPQELNTFPARFPKIWETLRFSTEPDNLRKALKLEQTQDLRDAQKLIKASEKFWNREPILTTARILSIYMTVRESSRINEKALKAYEDKWAQFEAKMAQPVEPPQEATVKISLPKAKRPELSSSDQQPSA